VRESDRHSTHTLSHSSSFNLPPSLSLSSFLSLSLSLSPSLCLSLSLVHAHISSACPLWSFCVSYKRDLQKRPTKETYKRDTFPLRVLYGPSVCLTTETYKRDLQKRPTKETYKRDLQKRPTKETYKHTTETCVKTKEIFRERETYT